MACLKSVIYDPGTAATFDCSVLSAMTKLDSGSNLSLTFIAPNNGNVWVRIRANNKNTAAVTVQPNLLFGVLDGATVKGRMPAMHGRLSGSSTPLVPYESAFAVTGLTPGSSYTWDAACSVQFAQATSVLGWGGPNNSTSNDAYGGAIFEVHDAPNLIASKMYDPNTVDNSHTTASSAAMAALDTANLRHTFTAPSSGFVMARLRSVILGAASTPNVYLGIMESSSIIFRLPGVSNQNNGTVATTDMYTIESEVVVPNVSAGSHTWDAAFGVETGQAGTAFRIGGPNDNSGTAGGAFCFELWSC